MTEGFRVGNRLLLRFRGSESLNRDARPINRRVCERPVPTSTSAQIQFLNLIRGRPGKLQPPVENMEERWSPAERVAIEQRIRYSAIGSPETVRRRLEAMLEETGADEVIATAQIYDHAARLRSFEIGAEVFREISSAQLARAK